MAVYMAWETPGKPSLISKGQQHPRHLFNRYPDGCCLWAELCSGPLSAAVKTYRAQTLKEAHSRDKENWGVERPLPQSLGVSLIFMCTQGALSGLTVQVFW